MFVRVPSKSIDLSLSVIKKMAVEVQRRFGDEGLNLIEEVMGNFGTELGLQSRRGCNANDVKTVGVYFADVLRSYGTTLEVLEATDRRVVIGLPRCWCRLENTNRELCEAMMGFDRAFIKALRSDLVMVIPKSVAAGDLQCELVVHPEKRREVP